MQNRKSQRQSTLRYVCIYVYTYVCVCVCVYVYIYDHLCGLLVRITGC
jgi:hypothetical protein